MPVIREILRSFLDNPAQQAVPGWYGEDLEYLGLLVPQFLAHSMRRPLFIYSHDDGKQPSLLRICGFKHTEDDQGAETPLMILHNVRVYEGVEWHEGYLDFLPTLEARLDDDDAIVPGALITEALAVTRYLYSYNQEREYI